MHKQIEFKQQENGSSGHKGAVPHVEAKTTCQGNELEVA